MIIIIATVIAAFFEVVVKRSNGYEDPEQKEKENHKREQEEKEEAETEIKQKVSLFNGYNAFVSEKLDEFIDKLNTAESKVPDDRDKVKGAVTLLEKSLESLKQQIDYSEPARISPPQATIAETERRLAALRKKIEQTLGKASLLKKEIRSISHDFAPLNEKWRNIKNELMCEAQPLEIFKQ